MNKKTLEDLIAHDSLFEAIANHAKAVIGAKDLSGKYIYVNEEYSRLFHMSESDFIGHTDHELFPRNIADDFRNADIEVAEKGEVIHVQEKAPVNDEIRDFLSVKFPIKNEEQQIIATGLIATDITERYQLEKKLQESENRFRNLFDSSPDPIWIIDNYKFIECNQASVDTLSYPDKKTLVNTHPSALSPEFQPDGDTSLSKMGRMMNIAFEKGINHFEWVYTRYDNTSFWAEVTLSPIEQDNKQLIYCVWKDITVRKKAEESLRESEEAFRAVIETSQDWIWAIDIDGRHTFSNPAVENILGYTPKEIIGRNTIDLIHEDEKSWFKINFENWVHQEQGWSNVVLRWRHKNGQYRYLESNAVPYFDPLRKLIGFRGVDRDITPRKQAEDKLRFLASHDSLTGLYNRNRLNQKLSEDILRASRYNHELSIFLLDIDHFKMVNDKHGHQAGDSVLRIFSELLQNSVRQTDYTARYGGEEFLIVLPETSVNEATDLADRLLKIVSEHEFSITDDKTISITTSIGIATYPTHSTIIDALLNKADRALYEAKHAGRNCVRVAE